MAPVIARLVLTALTSVASFFGFEMVVDDTAVQAAVSVATTVFALWATLGLRRKDPAPPAKRSSVGKATLGGLALLLFVGCGLSDSPAADTLAQLDQVCAVRAEYREETDAAASGVDRLHADQPAAEVSETPPEPPAGVAGEPAEAPPAPSAAPEPAQ